MSRLISFAWAYSDCKERKPRITKWKILAHTEIRTHDSWFSSLVPYPWVYPDWYTNDYLKLFQYNTGVHCAIYSYIVPCKREFSFHVFRNVIIWNGCHFDVWPIDIGHSNSTMTPISYNYNTKYTTKCKHALALYDVAINSTTLISLSMHLYTLDGRHAWFHLYGTTRPARSASKATKYKMKNSCPQWDSNPELWDLKSDPLPIEQIRLDVSCTI